MPEFHIAKNLKRLRTFHGLRQQDVSDALGISRQAYSNYERGTRIPDLETASALAEYYHTSLNHLVYAEDPAKVIIAETRPSTHQAVTPAGSIFQMNGPEAKMFMTYKQLPEAVQKEIRDYIKFKKEQLERD